MERFSVYIPAIKMRETPHRAHPLRGEVPGLISRQHPRERLQTQSPSRSEGGGLHCSGCTSQHARGVEATLLFMARKALTFGEVSFCATWSWAFRKRLRTGAEP